MSEYLAASSDIAIIGMAGRFPGAPDIDTFWEHIRDGVESISDATDDYLLSLGVKPSLLQMSTYVKRYARLDDIDLFAASFFGYTPREATITDPQQRIFLECAWHALEDAGYDTERIVGLVGVYAGASINTYLLRMLQDPETSITPGSLVSDIGNAPDFLSLRVSYKLNLQGPSVVVQTACSTSLVAVHMACQSLLNGECDMALAGGVSIQVPQAGYVSYEGGIGAPDGRCRAFDAAARGTVPGSGAGVVVLKPLRQALADKDNIRAIIKGSAVNNDGSRKAGFTAPSVEGQAAVIAESQALANIKAESISYIEAHGTGTLLGDPIEVQALTQAFRTAGSSGTGFCALGSLKTNIGHLDAAAGIAGLIKTTLALQHRQLPPSLHFTHPNPACNLETSPFYVNTTLRPWPTSDPAGIRRAGVSSFGIGGTNAHVVLEEFQPQSPRIPSQSFPQLLVLSAKTPAALEQMTIQFTQHIAKHPTQELADVAATLQLGRRAFAHRRFLVAQNQQQIQNALQSGPERWFSGEQHRQDQTVAFLISGQGNLTSGIGSGLYQTEPIFRQTVDICADILSPYLGRDIRTLLSAPLSQTEQGRSYLQETALAQPVQFVLSYALARLWQSWGVQPCAMLGHSLGEYVAACLAGVFTCEDALRLIAFRGDLMQKMPVGAMLSVALSFDATQARLVPGLEIAALNGEESTVVSGSDKLLSAWQQQLQADGVVSHWLHVSRAFHSAMLDPMVPEFVEAFRDVNLHAPRIPYISGLTGTWITANQATDPAYWGLQLRQPVQFLQGLRTLWEDTPGALLEVGPGTTLSRLARRYQHTMPHDQQRAVIASMPRSEEKRSERAALLDATGHLWLAGASLNWEAIAGADWRRVRLPGYPFERSSFWYNASGVRSHAYPHRPGKPDASDMPDQPDAPDMGKPVSLGQALSRSSDSWSHPATEEMQDTEPSQTTAIEQIIMTIWHDLLGTSEIERDTDFFLFGGDSLVASLVTARLTERFGIEIPLRLVFEFSTVSALAIAIEEFLIVHIEAFPEDQVQHE
ncbi:MAG TPA: beta-ketoacyl synthase N-terminal-like domain-containing protein [Ktedonobacteraceae bacterium]|nr:beta-ketoacyl synthase N-terminal-like domain-containing protein [Ktedonobacteraceae bacterium]